MTTIEQFVWLCVAGLALGLFLCGIVAIQDAPARLEEIRKAEWAKEHTKWMAEIDAYVANMDGVT